MREILPFVIAIVLGGLYVHVRLVEIPDIQGGYIEEITLLNERYGEQSKRVEAKFNADKSELVAQVEQLKLDLKDRVSTSTLTKRKIDAATARVDRASPVAQSTAQVTSVSADDSNREPLRSNLQKGNALLDRLLNERPPFREHTRHVPGEVSWIRTSDADRKKWFDAHQVKVSRARQYIAAVERELAKLGE
jgi:hypothetical protein